LFRVFIDEFRKAITNGEAERAVIFYDIMTCDPRFNNRSNEAFSGAINNINNVEGSANPINSLMYLFKQRGETSPMQDEQFISSLQFAIARLIPTFIFTYTIIGFKI